jgi:hypothetical protein
VQSQSDLNKIQSEAAWLGAIVSILRDWSIHSRSGQKIVLATFIDACDKVPLEQRTWNILLALEKRYLL